MTFFRTVLILTLSVAVLLTGPGAANARDCPLKGEDGGCKVPLGEYFMRMPAEHDRMKRLPVVMILHDAGRVTRDLIGDDGLVGRFLERGYAVVMPLATKRRHVRFGTRRGSYIDPRTGAGASKKHSQQYIVRTGDGGLRSLSDGDDRGWYFRNSDVRIETAADMVNGRRKETPLGRDEEAFLKQVLLDARLNFWVDPDRLTVVGIGHGASLAWQLACRKPEMAETFAPVNGSYWMDPPETCAFGVRMIHTHEKESTFWPLEGRERKKRRFGQAAVDDVLGVLAAANGCAPERKQGASLARGQESWAWGGCEHDSQVSLNLIDDKFDYPEWWLDQVLGGPAGKVLTGAATDDSGGEGETSLAKPRFLKPRFIVKP